MKNNNKLLSNFRFEPLLVHTHKVRITKFARKFFVFFIIKYFIILTSTLKTKFYLFIFLHTCTRYSILTIPRNSRCNRQIYRVVRNAKTRSLYDKFHTTFCVGDNVNRQFILFSENLYPHTIFGVSLSDCLEQERSSRSHLKVPNEAQYVPKSPRGRSSFSSFIEVPKDSNEVSHCRILF